MGRLQDKSEIQIDFDAIASDIIIVYDNEYKKTEFKNLMTKKQNIRLKECIRPDRRFIVFTEDAFQKMLEKGFCVYYDEENNALVLSNMTFSEKTGKWRERSRSVFYMEHGILYYDGDRFPYKNNYYDICGQAVAHSREDSITIMNNQWEINDSSNKYLNVNSGSIEALYHFFGNDILYRPNFSMQLQRHSTINRLSALCDMKMGRSIEKGCIFARCSLEEYRYHPEPIYITEETDNIPPVPSEAYRIMERYTTEITKYEIVNNCKLRAIFNEENFEICCLMADGENVCQHFFHPVVITKYPFDNSEIKMIETGRHILEKGGYGTDYFNNAVIVYADDLSKTFIGHMDFMIKEWTIMLKNCLFCDEPLGMKLPKNEGVRGFVIEKAKGIFVEKYGFPVMGLINVIKTISENPFMERLYKAEFENCNNLRKWLCRNIYSGILEKDDDLERKFGQIKGNGAIHSMLGIPKGMLSHAAQSQKFIYIKDIKELFFEDNWKKYLSRMNGKEAKELFDNMKEMGQTHLYGQYLAMKECVEKLFMLHGCENWKSYFNHIRNNLPLEELSFYSQYLDILLIIGEPVKDYEWRLFGEKLDKASKTLCNAYMIVASSKIQVKDSMIKRQADKLSSMTYSNGTFMITWPENVRDIIMEGAALHHCAKDFVDKVAKGITHLLFIRQEASPDKPFYTLEIRNGAVRQCHGFANKNIDQTEGLQEFLKAFCEEKGIVYTPGKIAYGA